MPSVPNFSISNIDCLYSEFPSSKQRSGAAGPSVNGGSGDDVSGDDGDVSVVMEVTVVMWQW